MINDCFKINLEGHVLITELDTNRILLNKKNAIHKENMINAIGSTLSRMEDANNNMGFFHELAFGNGGTSVSGSSLTYRPPRVSNMTDSLYNQTHHKRVSFSESDNAETNVTTIHTVGTTVTDVIVKCTLDYNEPTGQSSSDNASDQTSDYIFDELGILSQQGKLLTHLVFHPVQKSANRKIQVVYTVRISTS